MLLRQTNVVANSASFACTGILYKATNIMLDSTVENGPKYFLINSRDSRGEIGLEGVKKGVDGGEQCQKQFWRLSLIRPTIHSSN